METVTFSAGKISLSALWWNADSNRSCVLLHAMPSGKESWQPLAELLYQSGVNVLAPDLRGHGASGGGDFRTFSDADHAGYGDDVEAAVSLLRRYHPATQLSFGGASIGANLAVHYLARHGEVRRAAALSAGLNYYGFAAATYVQELRPTQRLLLAAADDDFRGGAEASCGQQARELARDAACPVTLRAYPIGGHGTDLFISHPELLAETASFLSDFSAGA